MNAARPPLRIWRWCARLRGTNVLWISGYADRAGHVTRRQIWPLAVIFLDRSLMCLAFCTLRQDYRRFHLNQMSDVRLTDASFRPRRVQMLRAFLAQMKLGADQPHNPQTGNHLS